MASARIEETPPEVRRLAAELRAAVRGSVRFDAGTRALYATDASNYRQPPIGVVVPQTREDVIATVELCRKYGIPLLSRGAGTSLAGQCCNTAVVLDFSQHLNRILELDPGAKRARVEPGIVLDSLRAAAEQHRLTFAPDPASHSRCTLGGMIGNNSCGVHSVMAGKTDDNVEELEILTYDGVRMRVGATSEEELVRRSVGEGRVAQIYRDLRSLRDRYADLIRTRYPRIPRRVSGYNLPWLLPENGCHVARALVGSEGTCVSVLEATLHLTNSPQGRVLLLLGYPDIYEAADSVLEVMAHGPIGLEGVDDQLLQAIKNKSLFPGGVELLPEGNGWLLVEFGRDTREEAAEQARGLMKALGRPGGPSLRLLEDPTEQRLVWRVRESGLGATSRLPNGKDSWEGWEDSAVPPEKLGGYLRDLRSLFDRFGYSGALYGHFGQGCVHTRIDFDLVTDEGVRRFHRFLHEAADLVLRYGGSLSGEHGDGQARAELLPKMFGPELIEAFREFKAIWDPLGRMNPGKLVDAYSAIDNLRLGPSYRPPHLETHFSFGGDDLGSFSHATLRCVGVGECRRTDSGTMCPSYRATGEEKHSTRGRARLLFEMLAGDPLQGGWRNDDVKEALDLCLACKACKQECPVAVDMATYKAEFLSHYYEGRLRPLSAYFFGRIGTWAQWASRFPGLANFLTQAPGLRSLAKALAGVAPERRLPTFPRQTFKDWFFSRANGAEPNAGRRGRVILWADTFNNHWRPATARAAVEVLEALGYEVAVRRETLCCGRPLYDFGMLDRARRQLTEILDVLAEDLEAGTPIIGLEPSCVAVFRDELTNLTPDDPRAQRLSKQTFLLGEFLLKEGTHRDLPRLTGKAILHGHCHEKAVLRAGDTEQVLSDLGLDVEVLDAGCCGMAGSFGFEAGEHFEVSIRCGERVLLPSVRAAVRETLVVAGGFSCREQIAQTTEREALHPAQVLRRALDGQRERAEGAAESIDLADEPARLGPVKAVLSIGGAALAAGLLLRRRKSNRSRTRGKR
jgi:FAD/FMN-containing dehydrogenase/Fe-S oxidoreductase